MNNIARIMFPEKAKLFDQGKCTECGAQRDDVPFRDEKSRREAEISGMCQPCQDNFFGV